LFDLCGVGLAYDRTEVIVVPSVLAGSVRLACLVRVDVLGGARPLPVPFRGHDGGEVVRFSCSVWLRQDEEVMADPGPSIWPGLLGSTGPWWFGPSPASILRVTWPTN
jgi:hypothetical protein